MNLNTKISCPACGNSNLMAKYEAKYVYSYVIDTDAPGLKNTEEFLPFLYDDRDQVDARQYVECSQCGAQYPCYFTVGNKGIDFAMLNRAVTMDNISNTQYSGY